jgi:hypothetical protein
MKTTGTCERMCGLHAYSMAAISFVLLTTKTCALAWCWQATSTMSLFSIVYNAMQPSSTPCCRRAAESTVADAFVSYSRYWFFRCHNCWHGVAESGAPSFHPYRCPDPTTWLSFWPTRPYSCHGYSHMRSARQKNSSLSHHASDMGSLRQSVVSAGASSRLKLCQRKRPRPINSVAARGLG